MTGPNSGSSKIIPLEDRLLAVAQAERDAAEAPGVAIAVWLDGEPLLLRGIGSSDLAGRQRLPADAQFYIYSLTKTLIAATVLCLAQQGRLELDAPIQRFLPDLQLATPISIRRTLNHSGGLPDYGGLPAYSAALKAQPQQPWSEYEFIDITLSRGLAFAPGEGWGYSNIGYLLLKQLIERVSGESFAEALQRTIFAPLGLRRSLVAATLADAAVLTPGYSLLFSADQSPQNVAPLYHPGWVSHGVVISTAAEVAAIFDAILGGGLLEAHLLAEVVQPLLVPYRHPLFKQPAYGLGLMIDAGAPHRLLAGHAGGGPGYSAAALTLLTHSGRRITSVALANHDQDELGLRIAFKLAGLAAGALTPA